MKRKKRGRIKLKPNSTLYFKDWDFADYKPLAKNEMELYETRCPELLEVVLHREATVPVLQNRP